MTEPNDQDRVDRWLSALAQADADRPIDPDAALVRVQARVRRARSTGWSRSTRWAGWQWAAGLAAAVVAMVVAGRGTRPLPMTPMPVVAAPDDASGDEYTALDAGPPMQMGLVVRAEVPAATLANFGVTGSGDVQVDFVIGEDGRAHAFRLVR